MLRLAITEHEVEWPEAGVTLRMVPLTSSVRTRLLDETTVRKADNKGGYADVRRDADAFARAVGLHCIKGWSGVVDEQGNEVAFSREACERFMDIELARDFVLEQARSIDRFLYEERDAAKNA